MSSSGSYLLNSLLKKAHDRLRTIESLSKSLTKKQKNLENMNKELLNKKKELDEREKSLESAFKEESIRKKLSFGEDSVSFMESFEECRTPVFPNTNQELSYLETELRLKTAELEQTYQNLFIRENLIKQKEHHTETLKAKLLETQKDLSNQIASCIVEEVFYRASQEIVSNLWEDLETKKHEYSIVEEKLTRELQDLNLFKDKLETQSAKQLELKRALEKKSLQQASLQKKLEQKEQELQESKFPEESKEALLHKFLSLEPKSN